MTPVHSLDIDGHEQQRLQALAGVHGRKAESLFVWWEWERVDLARTGIAPKRLQIVDAILARREQMAPVVTAVFESPVSVAQAIRFFDACVTGAMHRHPKAQIDMSAARAELRRGYAQLAKKADELAQLLDDQEAMRERFSIAEPEEATSADGLFVLAGRAAASATPGFGPYIEGPMNALRAQFINSTYWPSTAVMLRALAQAHRDAEPEFMHAEDRAAMSSKTRPGTVPGLLRALRPYLQGVDGLWPAIALTDELMSQLVCVLLDRPADCVNAGLVKKARQRATKLEPR